MVKLFRHGKLCMVLMACLLTITLTGCKSLLGGNEDKTIEQSKARLEMIIRENDEYRVPQLVELEMGLHEMMYRDNFSKKQNDYKQKLEDLIVLSRSFEKWWEKMEVPGKFDMEQKQHFYAMKNAHLAIIKEVDKMLVDNYKNPDKFKKHELEKIEKLLDKLERPILERSVDYVYLQRSLSKYNSDYSRLTKKELQRMGIHLEVPKE